MVINFYRRYAYYTPHIQTLNKNPAVSFLRTKGVELIACVYMYLFFLHIIIGIFTYSTLNSQSRQAEEINKLAHYFFIAAAFILLVVTVLTFYILHQFKAKANTAEYEAKEVNRKWEILMIGVPSLLVVYFFFLSIRTMGKVLPDANGKKPDVVITGHQWWWEANYPNAGVTAANEIHLPVGKTVLMKLLSADVIHDWWVPQLGNKMDLVSGRENYLWVTIKNPGVYWGACSEFCGAQHAGMRIVIIAQPQQQYDEWLRTHAAPAALPTDTLASRGMQIFLTKTCGNCHAINGIGAKGKAGPDLTHIASRQTLLAGIVKNNNDNLDKWLHDPQKMKPGAHMPNFLLDQHSVKALTAYLSSLK